MGLWNSPQSAASQTQFTIYTITRKFTLLETKPKAIVHVTHIWWMSKVYIWTLKVPLNSIHPNQLLSLTKSLAQNHTETQKIGVHWPTQNNDEISFLTHTKNSQKSSISWLTTPQRPLYKTLSIILEKIKSEKYSDSDLNAHQNVLTLKPYLLNFLSQFLRVEVK